MDVMDTQVRDDLDLVCIMYHVYSLSPLLSEHGSFLYGQPFLGFKTTDLLNVGRVDI